MKGNKFLAAVLAASMMLGTMPTMAVNAFAAATVVSPTVTDNDTTSDAYKIKTALAAGTVSATSDLRSDMDASKVSVTDTGTIDSVTTNATVTGVGSAGIQLADAATTLNSNGKAAYDIKTPQVNVNVSLTTGTGANAKPAGSGTVSADAEALTASEKIAVAKTILTADYGALTYYDNDDAGSLKTKINALLSDSNLTHTTAALALNDHDPKQDGDVDLSYSVTRGQVVSPTDKADGSITYTVTWTATPYVRNDTTGLIVAGTPVTDSTTITGTIPSTNRNADTDSFEDEVIAAVQAADFTTDDFDTSTSTTALNGNGITKLTNALKNVDAIGKDDEAFSEITAAKVTVNRYTAGKHGTPGSARLTFTVKRNTGINKNETASVTVRVAVIHGSSAVQGEVYDSIYQAVEALKKDSSSLQAAGSKAATEDEVKAGIKKAIDEQLARTLDTSTTIASEIASYEVKIPDGGYTASTNDTNGSVDFYVVVDSGIKDSADPSKTVKWYIGKAENTTTNGAYDTEAATSAEAFEITGLAKTSAVTATSMTLPETMTYLYGSKGLKLQPTFTPSDANKYTIKWENSNTTAFGFYASEDATTEIGAADIVKYDKIPVLKTKKDGSSERTSGSTTITATLYDKDGNVLSKASTVVSIGKGFADVQNPSFFAYKAINALADTKIWKQTAKNGVNGASSDQYGPVASPVIDGVGDNMFAPNKDVTRAEFVTMLYRLAKNDYSYLSAVEKIGQKDPATVGTTTKFTDVSSTAWYAQAVAWATEKGVVDGKTDTTFAPSAKITRAEAVTMLYRLYANGAKYSHRWTFTDVKDGAYYADAVAYAANDYITVGKSDTIFAPNDNLTRAEAATFIARAEVDAGNTANTHGDSKSTDAPNGSSLLYGNY